MVEKSALPCSYSADRPCFFHRSGHCHRMCCWGSVTSRLGRLSTRLGFTYTHNPKGYCTPILNTGMMRVAVTVAVISIVISDSGLGRRFLEQ